MVCTHTNPQADPNGEKKAKTGSASWVRDLQYGSDGEGKGTAGPQPHNAGLGQCSMGVHLIKKIRTVRQRSLLKQGVCMSSQGRVLASSI